jgi:hypothetical protein
MAAQVIAFQKTYTSGSSNCVIESNDGGYISVGETDSSGTGNLNILVVKTDIYGDVNWSMSYGGLGNESGLSINKTNDGGYAIIGYTDSSSNGNKDILLMKIDSVGNNLWTKTIGGASDDYGYSVFQEVDGGFVLGAGTTSFGNFGGASNLGDFYLLRTDSLGNLIWSSVIGTTGNDYCSMVKGTGDKGFLLIGSTTYYASPSVYDVLVVKTDSLGSVVWSKTFGGNDWDLGCAGQQTTDGGFIISGTTKSFGSGGRDLYLLKMDGNGNLLWSKAISVIGNSSGAVIGGDTKSTSIQQTSDGGYIISGDRDTLSGPGQDIFLLKTDSVGNVITAKIYNSGGGAFLKNSYSVSQTSDGGVILSAVDFLPNGAFYLIKTDSVYSSNCVEYDVLTTLTNPLTNITSSIVLSIPGGTSNTATISTANINISVADLCLNINVDEVDGIHEKASDILIYPNPSNGSIKVESSDDKIQNLSVYNILGERAFYFLNQNHLSHIDINLVSLPKGVYFVRVDLGTMIYDKKVIIE